MESVRSKINIGELSDMQNGKLSVKIFGCEVFVMNTWLLGKISVTLYVVRAFCSLSMQGYTVSPHFQAYKNKVVFICFTST
jgi:hypothetical protein